MANTELIKSAVAEKTKELIRSHGIEEITVTEICETSGVNRRTFYRYFKDKYDVVDWIYFHDSILNSLHYEGWSVFDYMPRIMASLYKDRKYYINALKYKGQNSFRDYCTSCLKKLMESDFKERLIRDSWFDFFTDHLCEMTYDACIDWLTSEPCMPPEKFAAEYGMFLQNAFTTSCELLSRPADINAKNIEIVHVSPSKEYTKKKQGVR